MNGFSAWFTGGDQPPLVEIELKPLKAVRSNELPAFDGPACGVNPSVDSAYWLGISQDKFRAVFPANGAGGFDAQLDLFLDTIADIASATASAFAKSGKVDDPQTQSLSLIVPPVREFFNRTVSTFLVTPPAIVSGVRLALESELGSSQVKSVARHFALTIAVMAMSFIESASAALSTGYKAGCGVVSQFFSDVGTAVSEGFSSEAIDPTSEYAAYLMG